LEESKIIAKLKLREKREYFHKQLFIFLQYGAKTHLLQNC